LLVPAQVEAMQKLYGHDPELHYLMSAVKLLRDETALMRQARRISSPTCRFSRSFLTHILGRDARAPPAAPRRVRRCVLQDMEVYTESGLDLVAKAGEVYADELADIGQRAEQKGVVLPEEESEAADLLGDVLSLEARQASAQQECARARALTQQRRPLRGADAGQRLERGGGGGGGDRQAVRGNKRRGAHAHTASSHRTLR
jgi:hypothetical protein